MVSAILAIILVNIGFKIFMKIIGANVMFYSLKTKLVLYILVWFVLMNNEFLYLSTRNKCPAYSKHFSSNSNLVNIEPIARFTLHQ